VPIWHKGDVGAVLLEDGDDCVSAIPAPRVHRHIGRDETVLTHPARQIYTRAIGRRADPAIRAVCVGIGVFKNEVMVEADLR
jgi:hypothetical protein